MRSRIPFIGSSEAHEPNMVQGGALLKGEACSSRLKAAPQAERSLSEAISYFPFAFLASLREPENCGFA